MLALQLVTPRCFVMFGSWRWNTTGTSMIFLMYWACAVGSQLSSVHLDRGDLSLSTSTFTICSLNGRIPYSRAGARSACVLLESTQSGFGSSNCSTNQPPSGAKSVIKPFTLANGFSPASRLDFMTSDFSGISPVSCSRLCSGSTVRC